MLILDHPDTPPKFAVARENDALLSIAKRMTLISTADKSSLMERATDHLQNIRAIVKSHWKGKKSMLDAVDLLESELRKLVSLPSTNDFLEDSDGKHCTVCTKPIENLEGYTDMVYCRQCIKVVDGGRHAIDCAFGLWCI